MRAFDACCGTPWCIAPESLRMILAISNREHNFDPEALSAKLGRPLANTRETTTRDGVASIPVHGPIFRHANLFTEVSGGLTTEALAKDIRTALDDPSVRAILLDVDSPGGEASGISELAGMVREANARKPVVAYAGGQAASAGYWIASAADSVVASPTSLLGSIGAVVPIKSKDADSADEVEFVSSDSPAKRADPKSDIGKANYQRMADDIGRAFVAEVAGYRGVDEKVVRSDFGQGSQLVGRHAVTAGLADRIGTYEGVLAELATGTYQRRSVPQPTRTQEPPMSDDNKAPEPAPASTTLRPADRSATAEDAPVTLTRAELEALKAQASATSGLQAQLDAMRAHAEAQAIEAIRSQAEGFAAEAVRTGRVQRAQAADLAGLYADARLADRKEPEGRRADKLAAFVKGLPPTALVGERLISKDFDFKGLSVLGSDADPDPWAADVEATKKYVAEVNNRTA